MIHPARILVVEDEPQVRQINYLILTGAGYEVDVAIDGQAGWEALKRSHYDLVLMDNSMPRMRGVQLIVKMRSEGMTTPIILASAFLSPADEMEFCGVPLEGRLVKPYRMDELLGMVRSVLASALQPHDMPLWHAA